MDLMKLVELIIDEPIVIPPKKYKALSYMERCLKGVVSGIDTDEWSLIDEFVWDNCQHGFTCEIINNETGERKYAYPDDFNENTISVEDLIRDVRI